MDKAHVQFIVPPRAHTLEHEGAKPWIGKPCPVLTAYDGLEAAPAIFETAVRARRVPGPTPYRRTPVSSMESRASQQLRDTTRSSRRNPLPVECINRSLLVRHEHLTRALVELMQIGKTPSSTDGVLHDPPEAFDGIEVVATMGGQKIE